MRVNAACKGFIGETIRALSLVDKAVNTRKVAIAEVKVWKGVVGVWFANRHL